MSDIIDFLNGKNDLLHMTGVDASQIAEAEKALNLRFADDFKLCLEAFGSFSFARFEVCGLCQHDRLNVVRQTVKRRSLSRLNPDLYVIEDCGEDGAVVCQNGNGMVFAVSAHGEAVEIADSLLAYLRAGEKNKKI